MADIHTRRGLRKNQSTSTKINSSKPGGNQMTQQNPDEAQEDRPAEQESQPDSDANEEGIQHDNPDNPNHRRENEYDEGRRLITGPVLGTALAVAAIIAAGAIGYIVGTSSEQARIPAAPPAVVQTIPQATTQQFRYPEAEQVAPQDVSRPVAYNFSATTMEGENFNIDDTLGSPTLLVFWSHW